MSKYEFNNPFSARMTGGLLSIGESGFILLDVFETSDNFIIEAEVPGVDPDEVEVYLSGNNLIIKGIKEEKIRSEGDVNFFCMERSFGPFQRIIEITFPINSHKITANYTNGVLTINLQKSIERRMKSRKIKVTR